MDDILGTQNNFRSLSIRDLLQARDLYHYHLINKANVVGTAIGLYLIRKGDPTPEMERELKRKKQESELRNKGERTFANSEVREYSWPCVLALINNWVDDSNFGNDKGELHPEEMVPKTLYLPDGRMVPVCVVKVEQGELDSVQLIDWKYPGSLFGGGMPILVQTQEQEHYATAGCLVSDGHTTYALTSRHVCGAKGEPVFTMAGKRRAQIGFASDRHLTRLPFAEIYPEFPGQRTYVNLDVGLIELTDLNNWTSQIFGLGSTGALADLNAINITTRLIDAPLVAMGAASGRLEGRIKALFYRYKSVGGYDYVSDFLISPREPKATTPPQTRPGDSGAIWHLVTRQKVTRDDAGWTEDEDFKGYLRPLALEWGGQIFLENASEKRFAFALATSLTTVCQALNVELVLEHNTGVLPYWGQTGHYSVGSFACLALPNGEFKDFMNSNIDRISFAISTLSLQEIKDRLKEARDSGGFVPLADVPDIIWKNHKTKVRGGRDNRWIGNGRSAGPEHPTHYADIDEPRGTTTLRELCLNDPDNLSVEVWQQFYDDTGHHESSERGLLPFRVWQFFNKMVEFASNYQADQFLCAAGILSHYVGDACQPLHGSMYADGYADQPMGDSHVGAGVHSTYETKMIDRKAQNVIVGISHLIGQAAPALPAIRSGKEAALAIIKLMDRAATKIPPTYLVDAFADAGGTTRVAVQDALWEQFGQETIEVMTDGARVLAKIWEGAWTQGNGSNIPNNLLVEIDYDRLLELYVDEGFVESLDLDHIGQVLT